MRRLALSAGFLAALVLTAVALAAGSDSRIHRLHLPPPPVNDDLGGDQPAPPSTGGPADPGAQPPPAPSPPGAQPPAPPPAPPTDVGCTVGGAATPSATGTLDDYVLTLTPATFAAGGPLTFRGTNVGADFHAIAIKTPGAAGTALCGTPTIPGGQSNMFTVTNLPAGTYVIYCTVHPDLMHQEITVS